MEIRSVFSLAGLILAVAVAATVYVYEITPGTLTLLESVPKLNIGVGPI